ncbi:hypothetical protein DER46DRAFT_603506 [Fusarium sp. MPI-SDFR-AT-0072]|nr:hypothetical protein DER46DRAFT_603506 [Fusarium sp. MPI-SDFR-AT-0072]
MKHPLILHELRGFYQFMFSKWLQGKLPTYFWQLSILEKDQQGKSPTLHGSIVSGGINHYYSHQTRPKSSSYTVRSSLNSLNQTA